MDTTCDAPASPYAIASPPHPVTTPRYAPASPPHVVTSPYAVASPPHAVAPPADARGSLDTTAFLNTATELSSVVGVRKTAKQKAEASKNLQQMFRKLQDDVTKAFGTQTNPDMIAVSNEWVKTVMQLKDVFPLSTADGLSRENVADYPIANILQEYTRLNRDSQNHAYGIALYADGTYASSF